MFGSGDSAQVLHQLERYHQEGRDELAEVMSSDLTEKLSARKDRDEKTQEVLVKGLIILAKILHSRSKYKRARATVIILHKERRVLNKQYRQVDALTLAEDYRLAGKIHAAAGKKSAAKKAYAKCQRQAPGHIAAALEAVEAIGPTKGLLKTLNAASNAAGPVLMRGEYFILEPVGLPPADAMRVAAALNNEQTTRINAEIQAITAGEQAANARLAAAIDTLKPTMDYHAYSGS
jgi:hypothetical protein